jgi:acetaldehyde dehydrogenase/alcohol dehydrogenase
VEEKVAKLIEAIEQLLDRLAFPRSIAEVGISKEEFEKAMPDLVKNAFDDPSWRSNPRMPLMTEMVELFWKGYRGRGAGTATEKAEFKPCEGAYGDHCCVPDVG